MIAAGSDKDVDLSCTDDSSPLLASPPIDSPSLDFPTKGKAPAQINGGQVRFAALSLLARREHSCFELREKLQRRFPPSVLSATFLIDEVLQNLADEALQSDVRFAEAFVAMRVRKGQGPVRINQDLTHKRVPQDLIEQALAPYADKWTDCAREVWQKKYAKMNNKTAQERARQTRFLLYRGFTAEQIQAIWKND